MNTTPPSHIFPQTVSPHLLIVHSSSVFRSAATDRIAFNKLERCLSKSIELAVVEVGSGPF